jgi:hypothetical protein
VVKRKRVVHSLRPHPPPPWLPGHLIPNLSEPVEFGPGHHGVETRAAAAMMLAPSAPANRPQRVTPPLVPRGTLRSVGEVNRRGVEVERMPSSEEKVSAATAA